MTPEVYRAVIDEAHKRGPARRRAPVLPRRRERAARRRRRLHRAQRSRRCEVDAAFVDEAQGIRRCYTPTLMREVSTYVYESTPAFFSDSLFLKHANQAWVATGSEPTRQQATRTNAAAQTYKAQLPVATRNMKKLSDAGVPIAMGTDTGPMGRFQGYFELMELEMMVKAGLSTAAVLNSANAVAARAWVSIATSARSRAASGLTSSCSTPTRWPTSPTCGASTRSGSPAIACSASRSIVRVHLVDGTYELFRSYFGAPKALHDGAEVGATRGIMRSLHVAAARRRRHARRRRVRHGHRVVPQRPVRRATRPATAFLTT